MSICFDFIDVPTSSMGMMQVIRLAELRALAFLDGPSDQTGGRLKRYQASIRLVHHTSCKKHGVIFVLGATAYVKTDRMRHGSRSAAYVEVYFMIDGAGYIGHLEDVGNGNRQVGDDSFVNRFFPLSIKRMAKTPEPRHVKLTTQLINIQNAQNEQMLQAAKARYEEEKEEAKRRMGDVAAARLQATLDALADDGIYEKTGDNSDNGWTDSGA